MKEILSPVATFFHQVLPGWVALPDLTFVMPHIVYWAGLILFPPFAMYMVHQARKKQQAIVTKPIAYLLWFWGGFGGLHRFYLRSPVPGLIYVGLFVMLLTGNNLATDARNVKSGFDNQVKISQSMAKRHKKDIAKGRKNADKKLKAVIQELTIKQQNADVARLALERWHSFGGGIFAVIIVFLIIDAWRIPGLVKRTILAEKDSPVDKVFEVMDRSAKLDGRDLISTPFIKFVDSISGWSGNFVAYWSVLAVFFYYYEVIARYVFNSPTNWVHESMFLMFGMQYLLSGAYALREGAHVRVDVIYEKFSSRTRTIIDIVTSIVFFIFTITLILTGLLFAKDSLGVFEVSFTEWAIQYWPVKMTIAIGGTLLLLQGIAKLMRDLIYLKSLKEA
jgi:TRAP-type mannitol/chloroaromatic compound transport system permease small subunit